MTLTPSERAVLLTQFLNGIGYGLVFPVAAYTAESFGTSATVITLLVAVHPFVRLLSGPLWGMLADSLGRRPVLLLGIAIASVGHLAFSVSGSVGGLALARVLTGLGTGDTVAAAAMVADTTSGEARAAGLGRLRAAYGLGMLAGPVLGGLSALWGLSWPPRIAAALCALNLLVAWRSLVETRTGRPALERLDWSLLRTPNVRQALWIAFAAMLALASAESIVALAIEHVMIPVLAWELDPTRLALLLTVGLIMVWGFSQAFMEGWAAGQLVRRFGERPMVVVGLLGWAAAFAVTPLAYLSGLGAGVAVLVATALAAGLSSTALASLYSRSLPDDRQGSGFGLYQAAAAAGECVGPAMAGALFERWFGLPYVVGTALLLTGLVAAAGLGDARRTERALQGSSSARP